MWLQQEISFMSGEKCTVYMRTNIQYKHDSNKDEANRHAHVNEKTSQSPQGLKYRQ